MRLNRELLSATDLPSDPHSLYAVLNAHGVYHSRRYVLRLSPQVHEKLAKFPTGMGIATGVDFESAQAMSTYLHETVHWWQHVGTTTGLLSSLIYPAQAHANHNHLMKLLEMIGPKKSLRRFSELSPGHGVPETPDGLATIVVNNQCDLEFFAALVTSPRAIKEVTQDPYFESIGHAHQVAYGNVLAVLAATFDKDCHFLPDPRNWGPEFSALRDAKVEGFYYGSPVGLPPIGTLQIFEGQARFAQLQFLYFASGGRLLWDDAKELGMLSGVYVEAFEHFLKLAELEWPASIDSPTVGLFLSLCDIACNPGEGFPLPLVDPSRFITATDPGTRFVYLCRAVALAHPDVAHVVKTYSRQEYVEISERLTKTLNLSSPLAACAELARWATEGQEFRELMERHRKYSVGRTNVPVQLLFGHGMAFAIDKLANPEIFCWPGAWFTGERCGPNAIDLFARNAARFIDKADDTTVYPALPAGADEKTVDETFQVFYATHSVYGLTRQWIKDPGPFRYDYRWLQPNGTDAEHKAWADTSFQQVFRIRPDDFELLSSSQ